MLAGRAASSLTARETVKPHRALVNYLGPGTAVHLHTLLTGAVVCSRHCFRHRVILDPMVSVRRRANMITVIERVCDMHMHMYVTPCIWIGSDRNTTASPLFFNQAG